MKKLSVVLATYNEEKNIKNCLGSVKGIADEIIVVDEGSTDKTRDIARKAGAKVFKEKHEPIFHITKQKALDKATGDWIIQLDADERVTDALASEIKEVVNLTNSELLKRVLGHPEQPQGVEGSLKKKLSLFERHQKLIEQRDGPISKKNGEIAAFFIPRVNYFLGKPLKYGGAYPDGVIRLIKKGKARFPVKSVHEQIEVEGEVAWLFNDLEHHDSPTFHRYLERANRYTDLAAEDMKEKDIPANYWNLFKYSFLLPVTYFLSLFIRHKGFLDGMRGFIWSLFSALHYPLAYFKYWQTRKA